MRGLKIAAVSLGFALAAPGVAAAQEGLAAGVMAGALTGGIIGGPIGAAIGGFAGAAIGGAAEADHARRQGGRRVAYFGGEAYPRQHAPEPNRRWRTAPAYLPERTVPAQDRAVQRPRLASAVIERTCVRDRAGNQTCREIVR